jgi:hypothetical protein
VQLLEDGGQPLEVRCRPVVTDVEVGGDGRRAVDGGGDAAYYDEVDPGVGEALQDGDRVERRGLPPPPP